MADRTVTRYIRGRVFALALLVGAYLAVQQLVAVPGPLTPAANLRVKTDAAGSLITSYAAMSGSAGPLTPFANAMVRTDANGYLLTTAGTGTFTPDSICLDAANHDACLSRGGTGILTLLNGAGTDFTRLQFGGTTASFPSLKRNSTALECRVADDSGFCNMTANAFIVASALRGAAGGNLILSAAPTVSSGFGTSPTIPNSNTTAAFTINVGTGGTASNGVVALGTASTGWVCFVSDMTAAAAHVAYNTVQTASSTTTATFENQTKSTGAAIAWAASDVLNASCHAY